jgi:hypothetical protein
VVFFFMIFHSCYKKKILPSYYVIHGITPLDVGIPTTLVGKGGEGATLGMPPSSSVILHQFWQEEVEPLVRLLEAILRAK